MPDTAGGLGGRWRQEKKSSSFVVSVAFVLFLFARGYSVRIARGCTGRLKSPGVVISDAKGGRQEGSQFRVLFSTEYTRTAAAAR